MEPTGINKVMNDLFSENDGKVSLRRVLAVLFSVFYIIFAFSSLGEGSKDIIAYTIPSLILLLLGLTTITNIFQPTKPNKPDEEI